MYHMKYMYKCNVIILYIINIYLRVCMQVKTFIENLSRIT